MRLLQALILFHRRLVFPSLILALLVGLIGYPFVQTFSFKGVGIGYFLFAPLFHYFIYEIRNPNEYHFYHNLGLSRVHLWISTVATGFIVGTTLLIV